MKRRDLLTNGSSLLGLAGLTAGLAPSYAAAAPTCGAEVDQVLGQGAHRYRVERFWGVLDPVHYPINDGHGVVEDTSGRIIFLTNNTQNNLLAYAKSGKLSCAWEHGFPGAHGLEITVEGGEDRLWITDHDRQVVSKCTLDGRELRRLDPEVVAKPYAHLSDYHPTNVAVMPDGDFYVTDGYGSNFIHHLDPDWKYISSFGGSGTNPEQLNTPHAIWHDPRPGKAPLLVCDRGNACLKGFSRDGKLESVVSLPGTQPSNVSLSGEFLIVASLNAMILVLDTHDRLISAVGGLAPVYADGVLKPVRVFNNALYHPHDVHVDSAGNIYVPQWDCNNTYPVRLVPVKPAVNS